jgi:glutathione S-transferase
LIAASVGIECELIAVDLFQGEQRLPAFLEVNPDGKVPAIDDDGFRMSEVFGRSVGWLVAMS